LVAFLQLFDLSLDASDYQSPVAFLQLFDLSLDASDFRQQMNNLSGVDWHFLVQSLSLFVFKTLDCIMTPG
jgi:hypothetical protein